MAIKWLFKFPPHSTYVSTLPGKTEQTKYALKWITNVNKLEIRSHKNLMTAVWANEEHRLLTYCSTSCYQTRRWWHVRVTAVQRIGSRSDRAVGVRNLRLYLSGSVVPNSPELTSIRSITSCGGHATAGLSEDVQVCGRTQEATGWNLDWSGARTVLTLLSTHARNRLHACVRAKGRHFEHWL